MLTHGGEHDLAFRPFPLPAPLGGRLDAVIHRVAEQVQQRVAELVQDRPIELDLLPLDAERHLLPQLAGEIPDEARKTVEQLPDWRHPRLDDLGLEIG